MDSTSEILLETRRGFIILINIIYLLINIIIINIHEMSFVHLCRVSRLWNPSSG
jgi:hypothetical protein